MLVVVVVQPMWSIFDVVKINGVASDRTCTQMVWDDVPCPKGTSRPPSEVESATIGLAAQNNYRCTFASLVTRKPAAGMPGPGNGAVKPRLLHSFPPPMLPPIALAVNPARAPPATCARQALGYQPELLYNIALCYYKTKQFGPALKHLAEIIEKAVREHPELSVGRCARVCMGIACVRVGIERVRVRAVSGGWVI